MFITCNAFKYFCWDLYVDRIQIHLTSHFFILCFMSEIMVLCYIWIRCDGFCFHFWNMSFGEQWEHLNDFRKKKKKRVLRVCLNVRWKCIIIIVNVMSFFFLKKMYYKFTMWFFLKKIYYINERYKCSNSIDIIYFLWKDIWMWTYYLKMQKYTLKMILEKTHNQLQVLYATYVISTFKMVNLHHNSTKMLNL